MTPILTDNLSQIALICRKHGVRELHAFSEPSICSMEIKTLSANGCFSLIEGEQELLTATYEKAFYQGLEAELEGIPLAIHPQDKWQRRFDITKGGVFAGDISFNWNSHIIITLPHWPTKQQTWVVKRKGFTAFHFAVEDETGGVAFLVKPGSFDYKKLRFSYKIEAFPPEWKAETKLELVLYVAFGVNLYQAKQNNMEF